MTRWKDSLATLHSEPSLLTASAHLTDALCFPDADRSSERYAAAHIRVVRHQIEAEHGITSERVTDWYSAHPDDAYVWGALRYVSLAAVMGSEYESAAYYLRCSEAALRTLWRRGQA